MKSVLLSIQPKWHNIFALKDHKEWWQICFPKFLEADAAEAWKDMPEDMLDYIKSLPEYDEEIFKKVTN